MKKLVTLTQEDKLHIALYHVGYSMQGESSIFILYTENRKIIYSIVIDCYEEKQLNITDEILKEWGMEQKLDVLVWTHPHDDHSLGIDKIIKKYCNPDSLIYLANVFSDWKKYSSICQKNIRFLNALNYGKRASRRWKINSLVHFPEVMDQIEFNGQTSMRKLVIQCVAPFTYVGGMQGVNKTFDENKLGIACALTITMENCYLNFLFSADMEKMTIEALLEEADEGIPRVYNYIKIPHHGSRDALNLKEFFQQQDDVKKSEFASASVYTGKGLPDEFVLKSYKDIAEEVACTSNIDKKAYGIGVIRQDYNLTEYVTKTDYFGTAASAANEITCV